MSAFDHLYACYPFPLSLYAKTLDSVGKQTYLNKLMLQSSDGAMFFIPDPFLIKKEDWKADPTLYPRVCQQTIDAYLESTPGKNYRSRSAYDYVVSGKVQDVKVYIPDGHPEYIIMAACVQPSQRCNSEPHRTWVLCKDDGNTKTAHCTCVAGFGEVCSHVFALLYCIMLAVSAKLALAPTEKRCEWNSSSSKKVPCSSVKDVNFDKVHWFEPNAKRRCNMVQSTSEGSPPSKELLAKLKKISPHAVYFLNFADSSSTDSASDNDENEEIPLTIKEIVLRTKIDKVDTLLPFFNARNLSNLERKTRDQRNQLWFDHRCGRVTASNFGEILRKKTVSSAFLEKFTKIPMEINTPAVRWGRVNEKKGYEAYLSSESDKHDNFKLRRAGLFISLSDPYLGCSPDGYIECNCCSSGVLEIKCPYKHRNLDPRHIAAGDKNFCLNEEGILKEDHPYYAQVQGQMAITNTDYCDFVLWTKKDVLTIRIRKDEYFWSQNRKILELFFFSKIIPNIQC